MCVLPRWHTQRCGRCPNSRYFYGQTETDADYLFDADYVFRQNMTQGSGTGSALTGVIDQGRGSKVGC